MASKFTKYDLEHITDYRGFESFCDALMSRLGYTGIEPLAGTHDEGLDALHVSRRSKVTIFAYSARGDCDIKIKEDAARISECGHTCDELVFVTPFVPTPGMRRRMSDHIADKYDWTLKIYDGKRIATLVDNQYGDLKELHPSIFVVSRVVTTHNVGAVIDPLAYARRVLSAHEEWLDRYTPLIAEHRDFDGFVLPLNAPDAEAPGIPVIEIPNRAKLVVLLGESGAGKTTALWRMLVDRARALVIDKSGPVPVLIPMLISRELSTGAETSETERLLRAGKLLLLIDGLNEFSADEQIRRVGRDDVQRLMYEYPANSFVLTCRSSDYSPELLDFETLKTRLREPAVFEIRRLDRSQISDYIARQFRDDEGAADTILGELGIDDPNVWTNTASLLHLARIPLYLQLLASEIRRRHALPRNRADLLQGLVRRVLSRERSKGAAAIDRVTKERLLGRVAVRGVEDGFVLQIPTRRVQGFLREESRRLESDRAKLHGLGVEGILRELLSNNFWHESDLDNIEWIHQFILDYFLACEIAEIYTNGTRSDIVAVNKLLRQGLWHQPCVVALSLLDSERAAMFLRELLRCNSSAATHAYDNANESRAEQIARHLLAEASRPVLLESIDRCRALPYPQIVGVMADYFKHSNSDSELREGIAESVSAIVVTYSPLVAPTDRFAAKSYSVARSAIADLDSTRIHAAVRRSLELVRAWSANRSPAVRFHAGKALWATDRGRAAEVLKTAFAEGDERVRRMVKELATRWNIE